MPRYIKCLDIAELSSIASAVGPGHANEHGIGANTRFEVCIAKDYPETGLVVRGHGRAEVTAPGPRSEIGKIGLAITRRRLCALRTELQMLDEFLAELREYPSLWSPTAAECARYWLETCPAGTHLHRRTQYLAGLSRQLQLKAAEERG